MEKQVLNWSNKRTLQNQTAARHDQHSTVSKSTEKLDVLFQVSQMDPDG